MNSILDLPEIRALDSRRNLIRIPAQQDVPITDRVRQIIDTSPFRRLARVSQLGLVSLVYPGATHSRFEHSLGVYRMALLFLRRLSTDSRFAASVSKRDAELLIVSALLHDIGHYPYCHAIEDMGLPDLANHECLAEKWLLNSELTDALYKGWEIDPNQVLDLLNARDASSKGRILHSILTGPIDIDKMDYLYRDSLHCGVPYGMHCDRERLIGSLCLNQSGNGIAITDKGCTAAELMVFARYVMFSEVYWHHAVRSATAMLQRAFFEADRGQNLSTVHKLDDHEFAQWIIQCSKSNDAVEVARCLFGDRRNLYKRLVQYTVHDDLEIFRKLARQPFHRLHEAATALADELSSETGHVISGDQVLIDAPPVGLEVQFDVEVHDVNQNKFRPLGQASPVVQTLAVQQFDDFVKRVRVFVHPNVLDRVGCPTNINQLVLRAIERAG